MEAELSFDGARLTGLHDVGVLIIEPALVHLAIIDIKPRTNLLHGACIARLDSLSRKVLRQFLVQH